MHNYAEMGTAPALAREQSTYCGDIVSQGVGSVTKLAAVLLDAPAWHFWCN